MTKADKLLQEAEELISGKLIMPDGGKLAFLAIDICKDINARLTKIEKTMGKKKRK